MPRAQPSGDYEEFDEGQTVYVELSLDDSTDNGATWSDVNLTSSALSVKFRAQSFPPGTGSSAWIIDDTMTKVTAASGIVGAYIRFAADYGQVECRVVLIDSAVVDTATTSGFRERTFRKWQATVRPCVRAA